LQVGRDSLGWQSSSEWKSVRLCGYGPHDHASARAGRKGGCGSDRWLHAGLLCYKSDTWS